MSIKTTLIALSLLGFTALPAQAQSVAGSASQASNSNTITSQSGAVAINNFPQQPSSTRSNVVQEGTATLKTAPSLGGLALGGGHPCAWSPTTAQISIIGGGAGYGSMTIDSACMLMVQSIAAGDAKAYEAAIYMIAARDNEACKAMRAVGRIAASSACGEAEARTVSTRNAPTKPKARPELYTRCYLRDDGKIGVIYTSAGRANKAVAGAACQKSLGF